MISAATATTDQGSKIHKACWALAGGSISAAAATAAAADASIAIAGQRGSRRGGGRAGSFFVVIGIHGGGWNLVSR